MSNTERRLTILRVRDVRPLQFLAPPDLFTSNEPASEAELQVTVKKSRKRRARISLSSPILRLPIELLQEIFMNVTDILLAKTSKGPIWRKMITESHLPLEICAVCQSWRTVAMSTPYLWQSLPAVDLSSTLWRRPGALEMLQELVRRSKGHSIRVKLATGLVPDVQHPALELLLEHTDRWASLDGMTSDERGGTIIRDILSINRNFPSLRSVHISSEYGMARWFFRSYFVILELKAPLLEEVILDDPTIRVVFPSSSIIQRLAFTGRNLARCVQIYYMK